MSNVKVLGALALAMAAGSIGMTGDARAYEDGNPCLEHNGSIVTGYPKEA